MRKFTIIILLLLGANLKAQILFDLNFLQDKTDDKPIPASILLEKLNWQALEQFCDSTDSCYTYKDEEGLKTNYKYFKKNNFLSFSIYKDMILEYESELVKDMKSVRTTFFDKNVWMDYVSDILIDLPDSLRMSINEPKDVLVAYYKLLGVDTRNEYGWICEYSTVGTTPQKREAVICLLKYGGTNVWFKKLLEYSSIIEVQMYAADALIYIDYEDKKYIEKRKSELIQANHELDSLIKIKQNDNYAIKSKLNLINDLERFIKLFESELLSDLYWNKIYELRDSGKKVLTCGNSGSFKIYETNILDLLSEEAISKIPEEYQMLKDEGYFR